MSARIKRWEGGGQAGYNFFCPGCRDRHSVRTEGGPAWTFNGDVERPVFTPSVLVNALELVRDADGKWTGEWVRDGAGQPVPLVCHSFVGCNGAQPGQIVFLGDCTHALKGQVVDLPAWPQS
jgi:hypothetical protein